MSVEIAESIPPSAKFEESEEEEQTNPLMMEKELITQETSSGTQTIEGVLENLDLEGEELAITLPEADEGVEETINATTEDVHRMEARKKVKLLRKNSERKAKKRIKKEIRNQTRHIHKLQKEQSILQILP